MSLDQLQPIPCGRCGHRSDLMGLLDRAGQRHPGQRLVEVSCPACEGTAWLELRGEQVGVGQVAPAGPGAAPIFQRERELTQPGVTIQAAPEGLLVRLQHRQWYLGPRPLDAERES